MGVTSGAAVTSFVVKTTDGSNFWFHGTYLNPYTNTGATTTTVTFQGYRDGSAVTPAVTYSSFAGGDVYLSDPSFSAVDEVRYSFADSGYRGGVNWIYVN